MNDVMRYFPLRCADCGDLIADEYEHTVVDGFPQFRHQSCPCRFCGHSLDRHGMDAGGCIECPCRWLGVYA